MAWTKAKVAIAVSTGILLAAGTTVLVIADEKWFELSGSVLRAAPDNIMVIRPTHFGGPGMGSGTVGGNERIVSQNKTLEWGIVFAYNFSAYSPRMVLPDSFPKDRFDYLITLPQKQGDFSQDKVRIVMQDAIKKKFGFTAHRETQERDVLLLQVKNPNAVGLQKTVQYNPQSNESAIQSSVEGFNSKSFPMNYFAGQLENHLQIPVLDQTGLTNRIAIDLRWNKRPGETVLDTTKRVVLDQLGLELVPSREEIEMLVVEKVK